MQTRKILVVVAVALLLGTLGAMAQTNRDAVGRVNLPRAAPGEMYSRSGLIPHTEARPGLPAPVQTSEGPIVNVSKIDPIFGMETTNITTGSALITPRGGAISTPQQQADREIRKVIRRLD
jgi:hypothetical protein